MTTEQLKELYATGEWICVWKPCEQAEFFIWDCPEFTAGEYKLIHKKHSEVLDHVLNGGSLNCLTNSWNHHSPIVVYLDTFIKSYHESATYEIVKNKPSLNEEITFTKEGYVMNKTKANELLAEALSHDEPTKARKLYELVNGIYDDIGNRMDRREAIQLAMEDTLLMKREDYDVVMELVNKIYAGKQDD